MHIGEAHAGPVGGQLNRLRAAVLGANDGIVSTAGLVVGVAGANASANTVLIAGLAGLVAGALSMGSGEYVSVSAQLDTERALLAKERAELREYPAEELAELAELYVQQGLSPGLAQQVAVELTAKDDLLAHARMELNIDPTELTNPWQAAWASAASFTLGAVLPLLAIVASPLWLRVPLTYVAVTLALALTGWISARLAGAAIGRAIARNIAGGTVSMLVTYAVGWGIAQW